MGKKNFFWYVAILMVGIFFFSGLALAQEKKKEDPLAKWKPAFDPSGAKYKIIVSNVSHPILKGTFAGFALRDELWKRTNGQIFIDYKPLSILGGEVEVMNQLQMGAIQGMLVSSVASTNLGPRFGLVNLPFLIDSFDKLDKFVASGKLLDHFLMAMDHQGIMAFDITTYGNYGWASTVPIKTVADLPEGEDSNRRVCGQQAQLRGLGDQPHCHAVAGDGHCFEAGRHYWSGPHPDCVQGSEQVRSVQVLYADQLRSGPLHRLCSTRPGSRAFPPISRRS